MSTSLVRPRIYDSTKTEIMDGGACWRSRGGAKFRGSFGSGFNGPVYCVTVDDDDNTYCGGAFTEYDGETANRIIKLKPNGRIDKTFSTATGFNGTVQDIAIQDDGKVICVGAFTTYRGAANKHLIRLLETGVKDSGFSNAAVSANIDYINSVAYKSGVGIICGASIPPVASTGYTSILLLNSSGVVQYTYAPPKVLGNDTKYSMRDCVVLSSNTILCTGALYTKIPLNPTWYASGGGAYTFDSTLSMSGTLNTYHLSGVAGGADNKYYTCGGTDGGSPVRYIRRYNQGGGHDSTFVPETDSAVSRCMEVNGYVYAARNTGRIDRMDMDGNFIDSDNINGFGALVSDIAYQSFNRIVFGGLFIQFNDISNESVGRKFVPSRNRLSRHWPDLSIDKTFALRH